MNITDKIADISMIWKQASTVFPYFGNTNIDWDGAYKEYLGKTIATKTDREHYLLLAEFINLLGDGHTDLIFPKSIQDAHGYIPFDFEYIDGRYYLDGHQINELNGYPMEDLVYLAGKHVYHVGNYVPRLKQILPMLLESSEIAVSTDRETHRYALYTKCPAPKRWEDALFVEYGDILYIRLDDFLRDRSSLIRCKLMKHAPGAVILDVRKNIGGMTKYGAQIASLFLSREFQGCRKSTRVLRGNEIGPASQIVRMSEAALKRMIEDGFSTKEEIELSMQIYRNMYCERYADVWGNAENRALFDGPCVLLTSRATVSAAEDFAAFFRSNHRATLIGTHTCGTTGTPLIQPLSAGFARICTVAYQLLDGTEFIGRGIKPDICVEMNAEDIRQGRDTVLEFALRYLR